ncbi:MAG: recombinase RecA [Euryarchaeota archaeon]|nr:recombinase RecA [Euryarchaeota archaeon]
MGFEIKRIPTGVADFDAIIKGGIPAGSVVLLLGDVGAGQQEYVYTSAAKLGLVMGRPGLCDYYLGHFCDYHYLPERICYVTFARPKEDILNEVGMSFNYDYYRSIREKVIFKDFSSNYFKHSIVPMSWTSHGDDGGSVFAAAAASKEPVLEALVSFLDGNAANSMIIIDSLTDLVVTKTVQTDDMVAVLRGMQRAAKRWGGVIYVLLTQGILEAREQQMVIDSVDGVLVFEWSKYPKTSKRQRFLYIEKFMSVMPHLEMKRMARFPTMVSAESGLVVNSMEMI